MILVCNEIKMYLVNRGGVLFRVEGTSIGL